MRHLTPNTINHLIKDHNIVAVSRTYSAKTLVCKVRTKLLKVTYTLVPKVLERRTVLLDISQSCAQTGTKVLVS